jgi:cell division protein FtsL
MKKGKRLKLLPFTVLLTALSFTVYVPGILLMQNARNEISMQIQDIERKIESLEEVNHELSVEVENLKNG